MLWGRPWSRIKPVWVMAGLSGGPAPALGLDRPDCIAAPGDLLCLGLRPLPARAPGVEAGVSIPGLAEEDTEKRGFWQLPGLEPRHELRPWVPRLNRLLLAESFSGKWLWGPDGIKSPVQVSGTQAASGGLLQGGGILDGLGTCQCQPSRPWRQEMLRAQSAWEAAKYVAVRGNTLGRNDVAVDPPLPALLRGLQGPAGGLLAGSWRTDTCCVTKLWHSIPACREVHEKHGRFYLAY